MIVRYGVGMTAHDDAIIQTIEQIRREHHACTLGALAARMQLSKTYVHEMVTELSKQGVVTWTDVPGSLRVLPKSKPKAKAQSS